MKQKSEIQQLDEVWPGAKKVEIELRPVRFAQMHDAFTPLQMQPMLSLSMEGSKSLDSLQETWNGIEGTLKGRTFVVPWGNISFYELKND